MDEEEKHHLPLFSLRNVNFLFFLLKKNVQAWVWGESAASVSQIGTFALVEIY